MRQICMYEITNGLSSDQTTDSYYDEVYSFLKTAHEKPHSILYPVWRLRWNMCPTISDIYTFYGRTWQEK